MARTKTITKTGLKKVYTEVKRMRLELKSMEETLEKLLESLIPEEEPSPQDAKELQEIKQDKGTEEFIPIEEIERKCGAKPNAKVPCKRS